MDKSLTVATFENPSEAEILRQELEDIGVKAWLSDETINVALWHVGSALGGVKVQIRAEDEQIAYKLITERARRRDRNEEASDWYCGRCREWIAPSFDLCWSCRGERSEVERKDRTAESSQASNARTAGKQQIEAVGRAWRASILGWAVCPPIVLPPLAHFYSAYLASSIEDDYLESEEQRRLTMTHASNWLAFIVFALVWTYVFFF